MTKDQKLERFAEREFYRNLSKIIIEDDDGSFIVFGRYKLVPTSIGFEVWNYNDLIHEFFSKRAAISWCVADNLEQLNLANAIRVLDTKKAQAHYDITVRTGMANHSRSAEFKETVLTKLEPKIKLYKNVSAELDKCVNSAKYMQLRGFTNETARSRRT